jgi:protein ImuA
MEQQQKIFPAAQILKLKGPCREEWSPNLKDAATKNEVFCSLDDASGIGFTLALASKLGTDKPWLWVQDKQSRRQGGMPYIHGLPQSIRHNLYYIAAQTCDDALFAMEEGLKCAELSFVIAELSGDPKALGFTASRRLAVASETYCVPLYLVRTHASRQLSAARMRWDVTVAPSKLHPWDSKAPGAAQCQAELFRSRMYRPGRWLLNHERETLSIATSSTSLAANPHAETANRIDLVASISDQPLATASRA